MEENRIKMSFIDKSLNVTCYDKQVIASIKAGFKFTTLEREFERCGFKTLPDVVVDVLEKNGYRKDYGLNMWVTKCVGTAKCNVTDVYNEQTGKRIAISRAKRKAYMQATKVMYQIFISFEQISQYMVESLNSLCNFGINEETAIDNVIEYGVSNPDKK